MDSTILRKDVYELLQAGEPFDLSWVTCNRTKGTGGDLIEVESWLKVGAEDEEDEAQAISHQPSAITGDSRDPHHDEHGTANIYNPANRAVHPHKVHIDLIQFFNGKRVIN